tara:strand:- start:3572 stop:4435 length:864 start_codon:yes stop_codon:yes gene_type:complete
MASPQKENGYTAIANELLEKIIATGLNGTELAIMLLVLRKTYGYHKKQDEISLSQFTKAIPVSKMAICSSLKTLQLVKILILVKKGNSLKCSNLWAFNKNYDEWQLVKKTKLVKISTPTSKDFVTQLVKKTLHTKETIQKKIQKKGIFKKNTDLTIALTGFIEMRRKIKKPLTDRALDLAINKLKELSSGDIDLAIQIVDQSVLCNWQSFYALKQSSTNIVDTLKSYLAKAKKKNEYQKRMKLGDYNLMRVNSDMNDNEPNEYEDQTIKFLQDKTIQTKLSKYVRNK